MRTILAFIFTITILNSYSQEFEFNFYKKLKIISIDTIIDRENYFLIDVSDSLGNDMLILSDVRSDTICNNCDMIKVGCYYNFILRKMDSYKSIYFEYPISLTDWDGFLVGKEPNKRDIAPNRKLPFKAKNLKGLFYIPIEK